jgi:hypothetical protein
MHCLAGTLTAFWMGAFQPPAVVAQAGDSGAAYLRSVVEQLSPLARVRLQSAGERWTGRLTDREADSLTVVNERKTRTLALQAIDTLWTRRETHEGLLAGAGFGALMFVVLQISEPSYNRSQATRLGGILFLGMATGGMMVDALAERWAQRYPE